MLPDLYDAGPNMSVPRSYETISIREDPEILPYPCHRGGNVRVCGHRVPNAVALPEKAYKIKENEVSSAGNPNPLENLRVRGSHTHRSTSHLSKYLSQSLSPFMRFSVKSEQLRSHALSTTAPVSSKTAMPSITQPTACAPGNRSF